MDRRNLRGLRIGFVLIISIVLSAAIKVPGQTNENPQEDSNARIFLQYFKSHWDDIHDVIMRFHCENPHLKGMVFIRMDWQQGKLLSATIDSNNTGNNAFGPALIEAMKNWNISGLSENWAITLPIKTEIVGSNHPEFKERGILTGKIEDIRGNPISGAKLILTPVDNPNAKLDTLHTNRQGIFIRTLIQKGDWKLDCTKEGYLPETIEKLTFGAGEHVNRHIILRKIEELIKVNRLNERAIVVSMGYDAVSAISTQEGIVVIDAGISNSLTGKYRQVIESEFNRKDFAYLINTHSHPDHIGGNQVFTDAVIVGHQNCLAEIEEQWKNREKIKPYLKRIVEEYTAGYDTLKPGSEEWTEAFCQKTRYQCAYNDLINDQVITKPEVTFIDSLNISMGDATLEMKYFGRAHSTSDIFIHIPELKLLFSGDLFFPRGRPSMSYAATSDSENLKKALQWLGTRLEEIDMVVGGHGQIMAREDLESFINLVKQKMPTL